MFDIGRMDPKSKQRVASEALEKKPIPEQTRASAPTVSHAINKRLGGELPSPDKILHTAQTGCVAEPRFDDGTPRLRSEKPGRRDKADRIKSVRGKLASRLAQEAERLVVCQIVELALIRSVNTRHQSLPQCLALPPFSFMVKTVNDDLMPLAAKFLKPIQKASLTEGTAASMIIRHDKKRAVWDAGLP